MNKFHSNLKQFKLITFDVTDTLLSFRHPPSVEYARVAHHFGFTHVKEPELASLFRPHFSHMLKKYPNFGRHNDLNWKNWWRKLICNILTNLNENDQNDKIKIPYKDCLRIADHLISHYETDAAWIKLPKANELINALKMDDKCVGVISNFDPRLKWLIKNTNLPKMDFILASYETGVAKPDGQIFDLALDMMNSVDGGGGSDTNNSTRLRCSGYEALHIGNTPTLDYLAAKNAGWSSILITNGSQDWKEHKDHINELHVVTDLEELFFKLNNCNIQW